MDEVRNAIGAGGGAGPASSDVGVRIEREPNISDGQPNYCVRLLYNRRADARAGGGTDRNRIVRTPPPAAQRYAVKVSVGGERASVRIVEAPP